MLRLVLPVLVPSWRFFDVIGPAPRIDIAWLATPASDPAWRPLHPRPARLEFGAALRRLFWNPDGNAARALVSAAERLLESPTDRRLDAFMHRVSEASDATPTTRGDDGWLQVRIVETRRRAGELGEDVRFLSAPVRARRSGAGA